jgi:hypothetical protein
MNTHIIQSKEFSAPIPGITADAVPTEIQWMPAGKHRITAHKDGKPVTLDVLVTAASAARLQTLLQDLRSKAATGAEDLPYIDFNHDDNRAAGYITAFSWGGDDPATGGIRAMVDWTGAGKAALQGREYRRFSPSFAVNTVFILDLGNRKIRRLATNGTIQTHFTVPASDSIQRGLWVSEDEALAYVTTFTAVKKWERGAVRGWFRIKSSIE